MAVTDFAEMVEKSVTKNTTGINRGSVDDGRESLDDKQQDDQIQISGFTKKKKLGIAGGNKIDEGTIDQGVDLVEPG